MVLRKEKKKSFGAIRAMIIDISPSFEKVFFYLKFFFLFKLFIDTDKFCVYALLVLVLAFASDHSAVSSSSELMTLWLWDWVFIHVSIFSNGNSSAKSAWVEAAIADNHAHL